MARKKITKIDQSVRDLFKYTRAEVTKNDILVFSPNDPGYEDYVKIFLVTVKAIAT